MNEHITRQREAWHKHPQWTPWMFLFAMMVIGVLFVIATPVITKSRKKAPMTTATSNAKQVFYLLIEFDQEFGCFPCDEMADSFSDPNLKGTYSNAYMRQLAVAGYTRSEEIFYARGGSKPNKKPDGDIGSATNNYKQFLETGECGFAYVAGLSTSDDSRSPILMAPMYGDADKFNPDIFGGKAIALRIDGSVQQFRIDSSHRAVARIAATYGSVPTGQSILGGYPNSPWGISGVNYANLHYADAPYTPSMFSYSSLQEGVSRWFFPVVAVLIVVFVIGMFIRLWLKGQKYNRGMFEKTMFPKPETTSAAETKKPHT